MRERQTPSTGRTGRGAPGSARATSLIVRRVWPALLVLLALSWSSGARASDKGWKAAIDWEAVKEKGTAALEQSAFARALELYREALRVQQRAHRAEEATLLFNIALTHRKSGRIDLAWQGFARLAVQRDHPGVARAAVAEMEKLRKKHEALPRLTIDCPPDIEMHVSAAEGQVLTDGLDGWVPCTGAPWTSRVQPGGYAIRVRAGGHRGTFELHMGQADQHHHVFIPAKVGGTMCASGPGG